MVLSHISALFHLAMLPLFFFGPEKILHSVLNSFKLLNVGLLENAPLLGKDHNPIAQDLDSMLDVVKAQQISII